MSRSRWLTVPSAAEQGSARQDAEEISGYRFPAAYLAEEAGVPPSTITDWARAGILPALQFGRRREWRFPESAVTVAVERASKIRTGRKRGPVGAQRTCALRGCTKVFRVTRGHRRYCSRDCSDRARIPFLAPKTPLARFLLADMEARNETIRDLARRLELDHLTTSCLLRDRLPKASTIAKLRAAYPNDDLPLPEQTASDLSRNAVRKLQPIATKAAHSPAARAKVSKALRGRKIAPDVAARTREAQLSSPAYQEARARYYEYRTSPAGRTMSSLTSWLAARQRRGEPSPTVLELRAQAQKWADQLRLEYPLITAEAVLSVWRPMLIRAVLLPPQGRRRDEARHQIIIDRMTHGEGKTGDKRRLTPADSMPPGFWRDAYNAVVAAGEQGDLKSFEGLRQWWYAHKPGCFSCLTALPTSTTKL